MLAPLLALSASVIWGVADFQAALRARFVGPLVVAAFAQLVGTLVLLVPVVLMFWRGLAAVGR